MTDLEATTSFGYWVRRRRLALDLTQADLARAVNAATVTITKIERDERRPSRQLAMLLAERLAIPEAERARFLAVALGDAAVDRLPLDGTPLPAPAAPDVPSSNLPTPSTPFIGRHTELVQLTARLADPACRLLTLLGAGGFGKTRLAIRLGELALAERERFPDGVFFVALDGLESGEFVVPAVAAALAFTFYEQQNAETQLLRYLAGKRLLLILDNAEGILEPDFVTRMLAQAPRVKIVVTTRDALNLQPEWLHPIGGMDVGATEDEAGTQPSQPLSDAVALFQQCARRAQPGFDLAHELPHVQHICRLVDGAPLAIELAAAWLKALTCAQVAHELTRGVDLLATSMRDVPARHRSMRAVLEQAWQKLAVEEQRVFRRLSVFEGGFRLEAAQAVAGAPFGVLAGLVEKAMLHLAPDGRYRIHALLRQLGVEELAADPAEMGECQARHAAFFMTFLADRRAALTGHRQMDAVGEIQSEMDNIRAAWAHLAAEGQLLRLREAMHALFRFLWMRGRYDEGAQLAHQALKPSYAKELISEEQPVRIALMTYEAKFTGALGAYEPALAQLHESLAAAQHFGAEAEQAHCHYVTGLVSIYWDNHGADAVESLQSAYNLYRQLDDAFGTAETAIRLAFALTIVKRNPQARLKLADEGLALFRRLGDLGNTAEALNYAALTRWMVGEVDSAEQLFAESIACAQAVGDQFVAAEAVGGLGLIAWVREQWDLATLYMLQRLEKMQHLGHDNQIKNSLTLLCAVYAGAERYHDAISLMNSYPDMWRTPWTAQVEVGVGAFEKVMAYLPQATGDSLANHHVFFDTSWYLVVWALLLVSDCALHRLHDPSTRRVMLRREREVLAVEILFAVRSYPLSDPATRAQAGRLLAKLCAQTGMEPPTSTPSVQELAQAVLAIQLG